MHKKLLKIIAWVEIILGAPLGLLFFFWLFLLLVNLKSYYIYLNMPLAQQGMAGLLIPEADKGCIILLPYIVMLPVGIGLLLFKKFALRAHIFWIPVLFFFSGILWGNHLANENSVSFYIFNMQSSIYFLVGLTMMFYFNQNVVRNLFKETVTN